MPGGTTFHFRSTATRDYPAPRGRVWDAFADEQQKLAWWGAGDAIEPGEWAFDSVPDSAAEPLYCGC